MESFGASYLESLISSLNYTLGRTSSAIQDRREVKIKPRGATSYSPRTAKTIDYRFVRIFARKLTQAPVQAGERVAGHRTRTSFRC